VSSFLAETKIVCI